MQGTVPGTATCPHAAPLLRFADPVHTPSQEHTYQTVERARIPEEPGAGAHWAPRKPKKHVEKQTVGRPSLRVPTAARGDVFAHFLMLQHEQASQLGFIFRALWNSTDPPASCLPAEPFSHLVDDKASDGLH